MLKSIVNTIGTKVIAAGFNFLIIILTANFLGSEGRGQISLIMATGTIILLFANFVGGSTLIFLTPRKPLFELLFVSYLWTLLVVIVAYITLLFFHVFNSNYCLHIGLLSLLFSFTSIHISILLGKEKIRTSNRITLLQVVSHFALLSVCFLIFGQKSISVFIYSLYFTYGIAFFTSAYFLKNYLTAPFNFKVSATLKMAFALGAVSQLANIFQFLNYRLDIYLLNQYDTISNIGVYSTTVSIAEAVLLLGGSVAMVQYTKISNSESETNSRELTVKLTRFSTLFTLIAYIPLFILPDGFYNLLLGKGFHHVQLILCLLAPGIITLGSSVTLSHYFAGTGNYNINALASFLGLIITFILGIIFIPKYGFMAAAIVSCISYFISTVVLVIAFIRKTKIKSKELFPTFNDVKLLKDSILNIKIFSK